MIEKKNLKITLDTLKRIWEESLKWQGEIFLSLNDVETLQKAFDLVKKEMEKEK